MEIAIHGTSDYGYYGKTGEFENPNLPISNCACGNKGTLVADYDDTPGMKETVYQIKCKKCKSHTSYTCLIKNVIHQWNRAAENN
jgi:hypothetical protein